jgi:predicted dehydrogenase
MPSVQEILIYDVSDIELQRHSNVRRVKEFSDLLSSGLDYVVIALPTALHLKFASDLAGACIPTLLEKPVALNLGEAEEIQRAFEAGGTICAVGHVERFNPAVAMLQREVRQGIIGTPHLYSTRRVGPYSGRIKDVGVVLDLATHDFD